jgi:hypothetical protein
VLFPLLCNLRREFNLLQLSLLASLVQVFLIANLLVLNSGETLGHSDVLIALGLQIALLPPQQIKSVLKQLKFGICLFFLVVNVAHFNTFGIQLVRDRLLRSCHPRLRLMLREWSALAERLLWVDVVVCGGRFCAGLQLWVALLWRVAG